MITKPTLEQLKEYLHYYPETGALVWIKNKGPNTKIGSYAGGIDKQSGYCKLQFNDSNLKIHQVAWLFYYEKYPEQRIDHINGIKHDNRIVNLREVNARQNASNMHFHIANKKLVGTHLRKDTGRWSAKIYVNGKEKHLGCYDTEIEAHQIYLNAKEEYGVR